jgi:2-(1,2-epoxy-1,2-dihydrophenyl)acetyl-CoA isomerase
MGLASDLGMFHLLPRVVGLVRAKELIYSARVLPAKAAQALGIVYTLPPRPTPRLKLHCFRTCTGIIVDR